MQLRLTAMATTEWELIHSRHPMPSHIRNISCSSRLWSTDLSISSLQSIRTSKHGTKRVRSASCLSRGDIDTASVFVHTFRAKTIDHRSCNSSRNAEDWNNTSSSHHSSMKSKKQSANEEISIRCLNLLLVCGKKTKNSANYCQNSTPPTAEVSIGCEWKNTGTNANLNDHHIINSKFISKVDWRCCCTSITPTISMIAPSNLMIFRNASLVLELSEQHIFEIEILKLAVFGDIAIEGNRFVLFQDQNCRWWASWRWVMVLAQQPVDPVAVRTHFAGMSLLLPIIPYLLIVRTFFGYIHIKLRHTKDRKAKLTCKKRNLIQNNLKWNNSTAHPN